MLTTTATLSQLCKHITGGKITVGNMLIRSLGSKQTVKVHWTAIKTVYMIKLCIQFLHY